MNCEEVDSAQRRRAALQFFPALGRDQQDHGHIALGRILEVDRGINHACLAQRFDQVDGRAMVDEVGELEGCDGPQEAGRVVRLRQRWRCRGLGQLRPQPVISAEAAQLGAFGVGQHMPVHCGVFRLRPDRRPFTWPKPLRLPDATTVDLGEGGAELAFEPSAHRQQTQVLARLAVRPS